ncbi:MULTISPECIES: hypothetical protein [Alphaproteobacteria]|uniref:hypothetical protein n=1 Tax=Alphaproteobacteria TaxID=28211 RepID=UPI00320BEBC8|nr:ATP-dependent Zn protease [Oricola sp.]
MNENRHSKSAPTLALRRLAVKALGFSGADIERLVREARSRVRREGRALAFTDLEAMLDGTRPKVSVALRQRTAVHEAGHAVVRHALGIGRITCITIAAKGSMGGYVEGEEDVVHVETEDRLMARLAIMLGGRAAERVMFGTASAGAGGSNDSDLAQATRLAIAMETALGFGGRLPLLHQRIDADMLLSGLAAGTAKRVHRRMRRAERRAMKLIGRHRQAVIDLTAQLLEAETLQGDELRALLTQR